MTNLAYEKRKTRRLAALGTNNPKCPGCGETHWSVFEQHHIADHDRDELTVNICANCHRKVSDNQKDHPKYCASNDPSLDRAGHFLLGLADLLNLVIERLYEFGNFLISQSEKRNDDSGRP